MKMIQPESAGKISRLLFIAAVTSALAACGGSTSTDDPLTVDNPDSIDANGDGELDSLDDYNGDGTVTSTDLTLFQVNPNFLDVNGDGFADLDDDFDLSGFVDQDDVTAFNADGQVDPDTDGDGNIAPDCVEDVCDGDSATWSEFAQTQQNRNPSSPYALGIQRILYCTGYGGAGSMDDFADGIFGPGTAAAVTTFQADEGIAQDGIVGMDTWNALQGKLSAGTPITGSALEPWVVLSTNAECSGINQFYSIGGSAYTIEACPGDGILESSPFTVEQSDLPICN